jgi:hypothetical protein
MKQHSGNGSGKFNIHSVDMGGWVRIHPDKTAHLPSDFAVFLSSALSDWFRHRPQLRMRNVVPISRDGNTVELRAWFDCHVFPSTALAPHGEQKPH